MVVPEKQGLKLPLPPCGGGPSPRISGGSRKTRIETIRGDEPWYKNLSISGGSRKTRIETNQQQHIQHQLLCISGGSRKTRIETTLLRWLRMFREGYKWWFQKNKDWNKKICAWYDSENPGISGGSRKTRIETEYRSRWYWCRKSISGGSRKTRIETSRKASQSIKN